MPLFNKKGSLNTSKHSKGELKSKSKEYGSKLQPEQDKVKSANKNGNETGQGVGVGPTTQTQSDLGASDDAGRTVEAQQLAKRLIFHVQLAHGSPTGKIENFGNVKELYQRIGDSFSIAPSEIIFCTLNSPKINMDKLLGGQIGLDDLIFAHVKGERKSIHAVKDGPALGLTITDNGAGVPFIKKIREGSIMEKYPEVKVGDHIAMIDETSYVGSRHFEVAKVLREIQEGSQFTLSLVEPKKAFEGIAPRQSKGQNSSSSNSNVIGNGKATLRLRSKGPATVEMEQPPWEAVAISKVDDLLESFLGIRDPELANTLIDIGKNIDNPSEYASAVEEQLGDFGFPDDFTFDLWGAIGDAKVGRI